ncbi:MAG: NifB/NifX family molybdenum-iron cluster-binding protein [Fidelibacterota bacterium]
MKSVLVPSEYADPEQPAGSHFGRASWYLFLDPDGRLLDAIPGSQATHHGRIFKTLEPETMPEAMLVHHVGDHARKIAAHWKVRVIHMGGRITAAEAARDYFRNLLHPLEGSGVS